MDTGHQAVPKNAQMPDTLTYRGGSVGGSYGAWMQELGISTTDAVQAAVDEIGATPLVDTIGRANDCKYNRPTDHHAYLTLTQDDARELLNDHS